MTKMRFAAAFNTLAAVIWGANFVAHAIGKNPLIMAVSFAFICWHVYRSKEVY